MKLRTLTTVAGLTLTAFACGDDTMGGIGSMLQDAGALMTDAGASLMDAGSSDAMAQTSPQLVRCGQVFSDTVGDTTYTSVYARVPYVGSPENPPKLGSILCEEENVRVATTPPGKVCRRQEVLFSSDGYAYTLCGFGYASGGVREEFSDVGLEVYFVEE